VPIEVVITQRAKQQLEALPRAHAKAIGLFADDLAASGCAALGYRLTGGTPIDRICVKHLRDTLRAVVAFQESRRACVLLIGHHDDADPNRDVYAELYALLGAEAPDAAGRGKPRAATKMARPPVSVTTSRTSLSGPRNTEIPVLA
jgi:hypothetical protein